MAYSNAARNAAIEAIFSMATDFYLCLSTTALNPDGTGYTEPATVSGYTRLKITNNTSNWTVASSGEKTNAVQFTFPTFITDAGIAVEYFLTTSASGGTATISGKFVDALGNIQTRPLLANSNLFMKPNECKFKIDNPTT